MRTLSALKLGEDDGALIKEFYNLRLTRNETH